MGKKEMVEEVVEVVEVSVEEMLCELENLVLWLEGKLGKKEVVEKKGRKEEVLEIMKDGGLYSVGELSKIIGISDRNISSQLSYLRKDGWIFGRFGSGSGKLKLLGKE